MKKLALTLCLVLTTALLYAQDNEHGNHRQNNHAGVEDSAAVVKVLDNFRSAIINSDQEKASELLAKDAHILESGGIETKEEYLSYHFHSDGKFLSAMQREVKSRNIRIEGNIAWISTQRHTRGTYRSRKLNLNSLELAVLKKDDGSWKIAALHWSSRSAE